MMGVAAVGFRHHLEKLVLDRARRLAGRKAGAVARQMLVEAAAQQWQVDGDQIRVASGLLTHPASGRKARFGELADAAAEQPVPEEVLLKDPEEFRLIGKRLSRKDSPGKIDGSALFTIDMKLPGMLTAVVGRRPLTVLLLARPRKERRWAVKGRRPLRYVTPFRSTRT